MISKCANYAGNVVAGVGLLPKCAGEVVSHTTKTISGLFFTAMSVVTFGKVRMYNDMANQLMEKSSLILPTAFGGVLSVLNRKVCEYRYPRVGFLRSKISFINAGRLAHSRVTDFKEVRKSTKNEESSKLDLECVERKSTLRGRATCFMKAEVGSRFSYALVTVVAIICRVVDLIIGTIAAAASILCLGQKDNINRLALASLTIFGVLEDLSVGVRGVVNPRQTGIGSFRWFQSKKLD